MHWPPFLDNFQHQLMVKHLIQQKYPFSLKSDPLIIVINFNRHDIYSNRTCLATDSGTFALYLWQRRCLCHNVLYFYDSFRLDIVPAVRLLEKEARLVHV